MVLMDFEYNRVFSFSIQTAGKIRRFAGWWKEEREDLGSSVWKNS